LKRAALVWFALSTVALVAPVFHALGNHIEPRVFGLPWSLVYVLGIIAANFAVLVLLYRANVIDSDEPADAAEPGQAVEPSRGPS